MILYCAQALVDRMEKNSDDQKVKLYTTVPVTWLPPSGLKQHVATHIRQFVGNPCQRLFKITLRKSDHVQFKRSLAPHASLISVQFYQVGGSGFWYLQLEKLKETLVPLSSVVCDCASGHYGNLARHTNACRKLNQKSNNNVQTQVDLQSLLILLPVEMRPLNSTLNVSNTIVCLGSQNSVESAFARAVQDGSIIELLD